MKDSRKMFVLVEVVLAVMVVILSVAMIQERNEKDRDQISVIIQDSDDSQWAAFKYGLKMAAKDQGVEMLVVSTEGLLTVEEEERVIQQEINHGADAVIVQPVPGEDTERMLKELECKVPIMLVESAAARDWDTSIFSTAEPDNYEMGITLAEELLKDYNGNIAGKTLGIFAENDQSEAMLNRNKGFKDRLKDTGAEIKWSVFHGFAESRGDTLENQQKVDFVVALDDSSFTIAGECSAARNLHGALIYGIGNSTEAVYYLDTGIAECLIVPDEFNVGYQSLTEAAKSLKSAFYQMQNWKISYTVIRREELFTKENQEIIFTMSQ